MSEKLIQFLTLLFLLLNENLCPLASGKSRFISTIYKHTGHCKSLLSANKNVLSDIILSCLQFRERRFENDRAIVFDCLHWALLFVLQYFSVFLQHSD